MMLKSTKIVSTIGPQSQSRNILIRMLRSGMNVARLNMSHGSHEFHEKSIKIIRQVSQQLGVQTAIMLDLQGPKIRTGKLAKETVVLKRGETLELTTDDVVGDWRRVHINYPMLPEEVRKGERIYLDDGNIILKVIDIGRNSVICKIIEGGLIRSFRGVNLPDSKIRIPALTEKDKEDLAFGIDTEVDYIALSFVRRPEDIIELRELIAQKNSKIPIVAKIEKPEAIENINKIIEVADGTMVARGDLGAETSPQEVPILQKMIINKCNRLGKPVITATQMLESMIHHPRPTRAEASDVANAIFDGTDAVMLSGETALGKFPVESVKIMRQIALKVESVFRKERTSLIDRSEYLKGKDISDAVCYSAFKVSGIVKPAMIIAFTLTGRTAELLSKYRPPFPILAMSPDKKVLRKMSLYWGVHGVEIGFVESTEALLDSAEHILVEQGYCKEGSTVVLVGGVPVMHAEATNMIKVHTLKIGQKNI